MIKMYLYFGGAFVAQRSAHPPFMSRWKIRFLWHGPTKTPLLICFCVLALSCWFQNILWQTLCVAECFEVFMYCSNTTDLSESTKWKRIIVQPVVPQEKKIKKQNFRCKVLRAEHDQYQHSINQYSVLHTVLQSDTVTWSQYCCSCLELKRQRHNVVYG